MAKVEVGIKSIYHKWVFIMLKQLLLLTISLLVCMLLVYLFQRHLIYSPLNEPPNRAAWHASDMQEISLQTADNLILHSWYKPAVNPQPTVLFFHGNARHIGYRMPLIREFLQKGFGVLLLEYRGYGGNPGKPTEEGLYKDAQAALDFLQTQNIGLDRTIIYGESLGTGVATYLAADNAVSCLILQSPYTSMVNLARRHYPWILLPPWDKFDSLSRIDKNHAPLLVLHGKKDELVPFSEGQRLFEKANQPKTFLEFDDKAHNNLWDQSFYDQVMVFIQKNCGSQFKSRVGKA